MPGEALCGDAAWLWAARPPTCMETGAALRSACVP